MHDSHSTVSRRSVLVSGLAVSLVTASAGVLALNPVRASILSGRITDEDGAPVRQAQVLVAGVITRTDGDGRFFMQAVLPAQGNITLHITRPDHGGTVLVQGHPERTRDAERDSTSLSLVMAA